MRAPGSRHAGVISAGLLLLFSLGIAAIFLRAPEEALTGQARAIDGDSLVVNGRELRLKGLDAPEWRQFCTVAGREFPCGRRAAEALTRWLKRGLVTCIGHERDRYDRLLVQCRVNGVDIGADLVKNGFAVDYGGYPEEEKAASEDRRGIWAGTFERPDAYRRRQRQGQEQGQGQGQGQGQ